MAPSSLLSAWGGRMPLLLLLQTAMMVVPTVNSEPQYEVCIACHTSSRYRLFRYFMRSYDPCSNIREEITNYINSEFIDTFQRLGLSSSMPQWIPETSPDATSNSNNDDDFTSNPYGYPWNGRELGGKKSPTCRDLCSTYPDCSAWCPNGVRRELSVAHNNRTQEGPPEPTAVNPRRHLDYYYGGNNYYDNGYDYAWNNYNDYGRYYSYDDYYGNANNDYYDYQPWQSGGYYDPTPTATQAPAEEDPLARQLETAIAYAGFVAYWQAMVSPSVKSFACQQSLLGSSCQARAVRIA